MNAKDLKIGISIGSLRGQSQFRTPIENPTFAIHRANEIIHENFNGRFSLYFVENERRRRSRRRRQ